MGPPNRSEHDSAGDGATKNDRPRVLGGVQSRNQHQRQSELDRTSSPSGGSDHDDMVDEAHQAARGILEDHREHLDKTSDILLRRETIEREQFVELLEGKSEREVFGPDDQALPAPPPLPAPEAPDRRPERARPRCPAPDDVPASASANGRRSGPNWGLRPIPQAR